MGDNRYDEKSKSLQNETPLMDQVIREAIEAVLNEMNIAFPCKVIARKGNAKVDIQPLLKRKYETGEVIDLPIIQDVPVQMPRGAAYWIKLPVKVGDTGLAVCSQRSLDKWLVSGGSVDPQDPRKFDVSDAVFFPGLYPFSDQVTGAATDLVVHNGVSEIVVMENGKFKIKNASNELLDLLSQLVQAILDARTMTAMGPQPFLNLATFAVLKTKIDTLKG